MCRSNGKLGAEGTCDAAQEASGCGSRRHCSHGWGMVAAPQNASARLADTTVGATFFNVHFPWVTWPCRTGAQKETALDAMTIAQVANPFIQTVFIVIIGLGYYFTIKTLRGQVQEAYQARTTSTRR